jgi:uncharacterized protein (TIGR02996 family)
MRLDQQELVFLRAVVYGPAPPGGPSSVFLEYADWLQDRGDVRGEYMALWAYCAGALETLEIRPDVYASYNAALNRRVDLLPAVKQRWREILGLKTFNPDWQQDYVWTFEAGIPTSAWEPDEKVQGRRRRVDVMERLAGLLGPPGP